MRPEDLERGRAAREAIAAANVVDGLFAIARAVDGLAAAIRGEPDPWHAPGRSIEEVRLP